MVLKGQKALLIEIISLIVFTALAVFFASDLLISATHTLAHDNYYWNFPHYQHFARGIAEGTFNWWNPYSHAGEPIYPFYMQFRFYDPINILIIYLGQFFTDDINLLYNWHRFILCWVTAMGIYVLFRPLAGSLLPRLALHPVLLMSSVMFGSFRQDGILNQFLWFPFIFYFFVQIFVRGKLTWHNFLLLTALLGLSFQSYFFTGSVIFLSFFLVALTLSHRQPLFWVLANKRFLTRFATCLLILVPMFGLNYIVFQEQKDLVLTLRTGDSKIEPAPNSEKNSSHGFLLPYKHVKDQGRNLTATNFFHAITPEASLYNPWKNYKQWGYPAESLIYLGVIPFIISLFGMFWGRDELKQTWLVTSGLLLWLCLGPPALLHQLLYYVFPPLWVMRHTHTLILFVHFALIYFYVLGTKELFNKGKLYAN